MSYAVRTIIAFQVKRFAPGATTLGDVNTFIEDHKRERENLTVEIDPAGIGDAFADHLASAGFTVKRTNRE